MIASSDCDMAEEEWRDTACISPKKCKEERRIQGRSPSPREEAVQNSTWPTLPYRERGQYLLLYI